MILDSFQVALFLICHRRPLASTARHRFALGSVRTNAIEHPFLTARVLPNSWTLVVLGLADGAVMQRRPRRKRLGDRNAKRRILERPEPQQQLRAEKLISHQLLNNRVGTRGQRAG
jgi:hypothetical protein